MEINLLSGTPPYNYYIEPMEFSSTRSSESIDPFVVYDLDGEYLVSVTDFNNCDVDSVLEIWSPIRYRRFYYSI